MPTMPSGCAALPLETVAVLIRSRKPRVLARENVRVTAVPLRPTYETLVRLSGPRDFVLEYAAALFAEDLTNPARPTPPLALEQAYSENEGSMLSLLLSRGMYPAE